MSMTCYIISFTTSFHIISSFPSTFLFIAHTIILFPSPVHLCLYWLLNKCHLYFVLDSLFQKLLYIVFVWVHLNCYAIHAWHLGLLHCSALPITKEWPVYSWIYGSEKSIARYRESPVGIFNFLSILWRLNPSKQRAMRSTKKF